MTDSEPGSLTRRILSSEAEVCDAAVDLVSNTTHALAIFSHSMDPRIYDRREFLDAFMKLTLQRSSARVRVVVIDMTRALQVSGPLEFLQVGRRLPSVIEFRIAGAEFQDKPETFIVADERAFVYRPVATRWDAIVDTNAPGVAKKHTKLFEEIWKSAEPYLRR